MSKKFAGKKIAGSHSTVIDAAYHLVAQLLKDQEVEKISLGIIRSCRPARSGKSIKVKDTQSGLELVVRGNTYVQTIFLYLSSENSKDRIKIKIEQIFGKDER